MNIHKFILVLLCLFFLTSCAGTGGPRESNDEAKEPATQKLPIPPNSPFAKIKKDMGSKQVIDILGPPKDQEAYATGKAFIPFYFGSDTSQLVFYYEGLGQIYFSGGGVFGGSGRVIEIVYDPTEDGYR